MKDSLRREREAAARVQEKYHEELEQIRADMNLSDEGRQRKIAAVHATTKAKLNERRIAEQTMLSTRFAKLEDELYQARRPYDQDAASWSISLRDASDRAAQLRTPVDAQRLLERALSSKDEVLARAVARRAFERSDTGVSSVDEQWANVARAFIAANPQLEPVVDELAEIEDLAQPNGFSPFSVPTPTDVPLHILNTARVEVA
jgi:hypothetical protein